VPTDACANQKPTLSRQIFQYLAKLRFHEDAGAASGAPTSGCRTIRM
jgi:hypothetical protein